jgi:flagellar biosynthesis/type III secretory pathway M-ring protein FliF/YscJ
MDSNTVTLVIIWFLAVTAFFVLWAILAKVVQRISNRKHEDDTNSHDAEPTETTPERHD